MEVSARLTAWIMRQFPKGTAEQVLETLRGLPPEAVGGQDPEQVEAALVLRCEGQWPRFKAYVDLAYLDWRDALVGAGLADDDWPHRLSANLGE